MFFSKLMRFVEGIRRVLLNLVFLLFVVALLMMLMTTKPSMPDRAILQLDLQGVLVEQVKYPDFGLSAFTAPESNQVKVHDIVIALQHATKDERILGLRLDLEGLDRAALPHLRAVRTAIETFKASGKPVMAFADNWTQSQYYLAATADEVYLHPMGNIALQGYSVYRNYVKDALAKLDIDIHVFRAGKYKSAAAPFLQDAMSDAELEANQAWLTTLWQVYKDDLFAMRGLSQERLQYVLDHPVLSIESYDGDLAQLFLAEKWVDGLLYAEQANAKLIKRTGEAELLAFEDYLMTFSDDVPRSVDNWVGVIVGSGQILNGEHPLGTIGADTMVEQLQTALEDDRVKAVVLRLNTPGGSALASESIRHAVEVLRDTGKPVVVSMGSMAASGGYWIASEADEIWASPATITGSIGVFGIVPNLSRALNKLGVVTDGLGTTALAGALRPDRALNPALAASIQLSVDQTYRQFIGHVAHGRDMAIEDVKALAEGRVWSGRDAKALGLVDALGDINDAIKAAARLAGIQDEHEAVIIEPPMNPWELMLNNILSEVSVLMAGQSLSPVMGILQSLHGSVQQVLQLNDPRGVYALAGVELAQ